MIPNLDTILANPALAGGVGLAATGAALWFARALPATLWRLVETRLVTSVTVRSSDRSFAPLAFWLARHVHNPRRLRLVEEQDALAFAPGDGFHLLRHEGRWLFVHRGSLRAVNGGDTAGPPAPPAANEAEAITLYAPGRSSAPLRALVEAAAANTGDPDLTTVMIWNHHWTLLDRKRHRPLSTVYMPEAIKHGFVADARAFLAGEETYRRRSTPWRRGYLLEGPPGTGKSSLVHAVASALDLPIYVIDLTSCDGDMGLRYAFGSAPARCILLIEDIDTVVAARDRKPDGSAPAPNVDASYRPVTLSGLLNIIDGVGAREGRILCMTSNHADALDPALLRPGRVDRRWRIDRMERREASAMAHAFCPDRDLAPFLATLSYPIAGADMHNRLLQLVDADPTAGGAAGADNATPHATDERAAA